MASAEGGVAIKAAVAVATPIMPVVKKARREFVADKLLLLLVDVVEDDGAVATLEKASVVVTQATMRRMEERNFIVIL